MHFVAKHNLLMTIISNYSQTVRFKNNLIRFGKLESSLRTRYKYHNAPMHIAYNIHISNTQITFLIKIDLVAYHNYKGI